MSQKTYKHRRIGGRKGPMRLAHHIIWENQYGQIPEGHEIHHIDFVKTNNDIENLQLVSLSDHQKIHSPHFAILNGSWVRVCKYCRTVDKPKTRPVCDECRARMARIERRNEKK